jgi:hypothetical protein
MPFKDYFLTFLTVSMIMAVAGWLVFAILWYMKFLRIYKWFADRKRNKKFKDYVFEDKIINECLPLVLWDYYDVKRFVKYKPKEDRDKILYTLSMLNDLPIEDLKIIYERRFKHDITRKSTEIGRITQANDKVGRTSRSQDAYYRDGKTSHYIT